MKKMFSWNFAKSAEALFSRWAVKRVCKFLLKKKLGKFILGDIDLEQLDVQLRDGTIQLSDLALNVDYLNDKVDLPLLIKEGSVGSLLVKMPWKNEGCQVEVDELEIILAPRLANNSFTVNGSSNLSQEASHGDRNELGKNGNHLKENAAESASVDVHEGVKTVAKIVKWFLTNFHVKIKKLIVAFDPHFGKEKKDALPLPSLVFRMSEIECGACLSDDLSSIDARAENFLGISRLTNFVKFQGALLEFLQIDDDNKKSDTSTVTPIITGEGGGFSGSFNLSIPWKHGSLDIHKVDAGLCIDPIGLQIQPGTIKWFLQTWETFKGLDLGHSSPIPHSDSPAPVIVAARSVNVMNSHDHLPFSSCQENENETALPGLQFITDWVPSSFSVKDEIGEVDFGASVDHFLECFDGMRSYQSALGSSAIWNWTSSVFTAITAASSLESGSLHLPSDQQHAQTSFKLSVAGIAVELFFQDDNCRKDDCNGVHYLVGECRDIFVSVQVCPQEMKLEGEMNKIKVYHYFQDGSFTDDSNIEKQTSLIRNLQDKIHSTLPPFISFDKSPDLDILSEEASDGLLFQKKHHAVKTELLIAPGSTQFLLTVESQLSGGSFTGLTLFSLSLPPVKLWLNFHLMQAFTSLFDEVLQPVAKINDQMNSVALPSDDDTVVGSGACVKPSSSGGLRGEIAVPTARVVLCFASEHDKKNLFFSSGEQQFVVVDLSSPKALKMTRLEDKNTEEMHFASAARSICCSIGDVNIYLVNYDHEDVKTDPYDNVVGELSACKIMNSSNDTGHLHSSVSMHWFDSPVSGRWLLERAKFLATLEESMQSNKFVGEGHDFAALRTAKDIEDVYHQTRKEIISGSTFCLHVHLLPVTIQLGVLEYRNFHRILDQFKSSVSCVSKDTMDGCADVRQADVCQKSILVECDSVEILVRPEAKVDLQVSLQSELPGSWHEFKLRIQKFNFLSVSRIGCIHDADFFWVAHREGKLWGSVTSSPDKELLLISCTNSTTKRGNGGGSNGLFSGLAGLKILILQEPRSCNSYLSISVKCGTFIAPGGRLDWFDVVSSVFILPSAETEQAVKKNLQGRDSNPAGASSFILNLVDVGVSYAPHFENSGDLAGSDNPWIACLLAASSFTLYNRTLANPESKDYKITVQDLGFLLSMVSNSCTLGGTYSVEYLRETGYTKVAHAILAEAILRTSSVKGLPWELECSKLHLFIETCNDTTFGLICLAAQLQQLFAPDLEESAVHLQTRWKNIQQAHGMDEINSTSGFQISDSSVSQLQYSGLDAKKESGFVGLMDEINEDTFHFQSPTCQNDLANSQNYTLPDENFDKEACRSVSETPDTFSPDLFICGSSSEIAPESSQTYILEGDDLPKFIENYCLSDLRPLSEISQVRELSGKPINFEDVDIGKETSGWYSDAYLRIVHDHVSETSEQNSLDNSFDGTEKLDHSGSAVGCVRLKNINVKWRMYSGSDWNEFKEEGKKARNAFGRDRTFCLELELSEMHCQYDIFPIGGTCLSRLSLSVQDIYFYDRSKDAPWKLVLGYYNSKDHPRESSSKAFKLDLESVRPDPQTPLEEYRLHVAFLPLLLHLHQSQLDFLIAFFGSEPSNKSLLCPDNSDASTISPLTHDHIAGHDIICEALLPYFQKFDIWPVTVRVDYSPQHVDLPALSGGKYAELANLVPWKGIELELKHVHAAGIYGWGNVFETVLGEWLEDISQNQIHRLLQGIPTIRSLFSLYSGVAKLVLFPYESYRKDRRVVKGVQRGTLAFLRSISLEAVGLGVHLAAGVNDILMRAEYVVAGNPSHSQLHSKTKSNLRHNQPTNARQGLQQAYESIGDGLGKSASALVRTPLKKYQRGGSAGSAFASAVRGVPSAAIAPASACASAVHSALVGIRNSLDPERKKESIKKYQGPKEPQNQN